MEKVYYFAYSHHMDPSAIHQLGIHVHSHFPGIVMNYKLDFNVLQDEYFRFESSGISNIVPSIGAHVEGMVYELDECDAALLDNVSGVPSMKYYRKSVDVHCSANICRALCYTAWPDMTSQGLYPSYDHLTKLIKAAKHAGISQNYQNWLQSQLHTNSIAV